MTNKEIAQMAPVSSQVLQRFINDCRVMGIGDTPVSEHELLFRRILCDV